MITHTAKPRPSSQHHDVTEQDIETENLLRRAASAKEAERRSCLQQVVLLHLELADSLAHRYHGRGIDPADLDQVARMALVEATNRADPERGDFRAYAISTIRGRIKRHFRDHGWVIRPPRRIQELQAKVVDSWGTLSQQQGHAPTIPQLAKELDAKTSDVAEACRAGTCFHPTSLDAPRPTHETTGSLGSQLGGADPQFERIDTASVLRSACTALSSDDQRMLRLRFFDELTQQQIADQLGVSQMQISRSLRRILTDLRKELDHGGDRAPRRRVAA